LAYLEFIHNLVETMDKYFENVCELDVFVFKWWLDYVQYWESTLYTGWDDHVWTYHRNQQEYCAGSYSGIGQSGKSMNI